MRWATCEKWEAKFDAVKDALGAHLVMAAARLVRLAIEGLPESSPSASLVI